MPHLASNVAFPPARALWWLVAAFRTTLTVIVGGLGIMVVALLLGFIVWDVLYFQPHRPQIAQLIASATEEERNPPETIDRLVRVDSGERVALAASWTLLRDPTNPTNRPQHMSSFAWSMHGLLWWTCVWLHLSEREQITLIVSRANMGRGLRGLSAGSRAIFNRQLASLSLEEAATLMGIPRCPNCFYDKRQGWDLRRDWLLSRLQASP